MLKEKFALKEMIYISLLATIATVSKVPIRAISTFLTNSVGLPAGIVGGVYYMFWIVAACALVKKRGTASFFCIVQIFVSMATSSMPIIKLVTYLPPGFTVDLFLIAWGNRVYNKKVCMFLGAIANIAGAVTMAMLVMHLPLIPTFLSTILAGVSGAVGGYAAYIVVKRINHTVIIIAS